MQTRHKATNDQIIHLQSHQGRNCTDENHLFPTYFFIIRNSDKIQLFDVPNSPFNALHETILMQNLCLNCSLQLFYHTNYLSKILLMVTSSNVKIKTIGSAIFLRIVQYPQIIKHCFKNKMQFQTLFKLGTVGKSRDFFCLPNTYPPYPCICQVYV
eukprot:52822_1